MLISPHARRCYNAWLVMTSATIARFTAGRSRFCQYVLQRPKVERPGRFTVLSVFRCVWLDADGNRVGIQPYLGVSNDRDSVFPASTGWTDWSD